MLLVECETTLEYPKDLYTRQGDDATPPRIGHLHRDERHGVARYQTSRDRDRTRNRKRGTSPGYLVPLTHT
jgi:hypothetical protein